jgi:hypothetical protein
MILAVMAKAKIKGINMELLKGFSLILNGNEQDAIEDEFDSPYGSVWIVSIDCFGAVSVLSKPNIHQSFFDNGQNAEMIGLPFESNDSAGVYKWTCGFEESRCHESGVVDDYEFIVNESELLYSAGD